MLLSPVASKMKLKSFSWDQALCDLALPLFSCISSHSPSLNLVPSNRFIAPVYVMLWCISMEDIFPSAQDTLRLFFSHF